MNKIILIGRLTKDPTMGDIGGTSKAMLNLAVDRRFKDKQGNKTTDFFRVDCWSKLADVCGDYLQKGKQIMVEGEMRRDKFTNKEGVEKESWYVHCENMEMLGSKGDTPVKAKVQDEDIRMNEIGEEDIDTAVERSQPFGF